MTTIISSGRLSRRFGWIRYLHVGISLGIVRIVVYVVGFRQGAVYARPV